MAPPTSLRRFAAPREAAATDERCDLCKTPLAGEHPHLVDSRSRRLFCACASVRAAVRPPRRLGRAASSAFRPSAAACATCASAPISGSGSRSRCGSRSSSRTARSNGRWRSIPARPAPPSRCCRSRRGARSSPRTPCSARSSPTSRRCCCATATARPPECYLVPIDVCYALTGTVRRSWKGFEGGVEAWREIERFFADLAASSARRGERDAP